jgi:hypothetical protein
VSISRKLLTFAASSAIAAASLAGSTPASAGPSGSPETLTVLTSGVMHVTTTTGKHLNLALRATRFSHHPGGSNAHGQGTLLIALRGNNGHEIHEWNFDLSPNSFTDVAGGDGTLKTGGQIAPYGRLSLIISPLSNATTQVCDSADHNVIHRVALKGTLMVRTHSTGPNSWGAVAHRGVEFTHGRLSAGHGADVEEACAKIPCQAGVSWTASHGNLGLLGLDVAAKGKKAVGHIQGNRLTTLPTPAHAFRFDTVTVKAPAPTLATSGGTTTLKATSAGGIATGSATLTSTGHSHFNEDCATGQTVGTEWNAHYAADSTPLTLHEQIFGPMTIAKDKNADFMKVHIT